MCHICTLALGKLLEKNKITEQELETAYRDARSEFSAAKAELRANFSDEELKAIANGTYNPTIH